MTLRPIALVVPIVLIAALAGSAAAQTSPEGGTQGIPRTAEEVQPWAERLFIRFDANQDGAITEDELAVLDGPAAAPMGGRMRMMILAADADSNARVTVEELTAGARQMFGRMNGAGGDRPAGGMGAGMGGGGGAEMFSLPRTADSVAPWAGQLFARLDANQDSSITGNELALLANPMVASMGGSRLRAMIAQSDANRDSRISAEELTAGAERMFTRLDRNGDGRLADDELPQPPAPPARPAGPAIPPPADPMPFPDMPNGG